MRFLITRPRPDAEPLAEQIHALGHTTIIEPLLEVAFTQGPNLDLRNVQALLFTSANGARAAALRTQDRATQVLAVGPATAAEAKSLGFTRIEESTGDGVEALAQTVRAKLKPQGGTLLHITGTVTAGDLKANLPGFTVRTEQFYNARAVDSFSGALTAELTAGLIDAATFFSPRTAKLFVTLVRAAKLEQACEKLDALALSDAVAKALSPLRFRKIQVAAHANAASLLDLLKSP